MASNHGLRGSTLEALINMTVDRYREDGLALIQKIPTPITPVEIEQESRHITLAYFDQKSTVDYIGAVQGIPVCFDAKESKIDTWVENTRTIMAGGDPRPVEEDKPVKIEAVDAANAAELFDLTANEIKRWSPSFMKTTYASVPYDKMRELEDWGVYLNAFMDAMTSGTSVTAAMINAYAGSTVWFDREDFPLEDGAFYYDDIIGAPVFDAESGEKAGEVAGVEEGVSCFYYLIKAYGKCWRVPAVDEFILSADVEKGVTARLAEGLETKDEF